MPRIFPIYLFTGDDDYLKRQATSKLKKALLTKGSEAFNFDVYEAPHCDIDEVVKSLYRPPFGSNKRVVLLKGVESLTEHAKRILLRYAQGPSNNSCLLLEASKRGISPKFRGSIEGYVREVSFMVPKGREWTPWINREFKDRKKTVHNDALRLLRDIGDEDIDALRNEIDKLVTYVGRRSTVTMRRSSR